MSEEEKAIIKEIEGKLGNSPIKNFVIVEEYMMRYSEKKGFIMYLNSLVEEKLDQGDLHREAVIAIADAMRSLGLGKPQKAFETLEPYTHHPDFFFWEGQCAFEVSNEIEYSLLLMERPDAEISGGLPFGGISHLLGYALCELGHYEDAIRLLENAASWKPYLLAPALELIDAKTRFCLEQGKLGQRDKIEELKDDLYALRGKIYWPGDFAAYMRKLGYLLVEERRLEQARACYLLSIALSKALKMEDALGKKEIAYIDDLLGDENRLEGEGLIAYLKENGLPFQISMNVYMVLLILRARNDLDQNSKSIIEHSLRAYRSVIGDPYYLLCKVRFPGNEKAYDYICPYEEIEVGGVALVPTDNGEAPVKVIGKRYVSSKEIRESEIKYKEVIRILLRKAKGLED